MATPKYLYFVALLLCATLAVTAQTTTTRHFTSPGINELIKLTSTGTGNVDQLTLEEYLYLLHPGARAELANPASSNLAKSFAAKSASKKQLEYAEAVDSVLAIRGRIALLEYFDCSPDDSWQSDSVLSKGAALLNITNTVKNLAWKEMKPKIEKAMATFDTDIRLLQTKGAPDRVVSDWKHQYRMLEWSIKLLNDSYLPNAERKKQFELILADINERDRKLKLTLKAIASMEYVAAYASGTLYDSTQIALSDSIRRALPDKATVARQSLARWTAAGASVNNH